MKNTNRKVNKTRKAAALFTALMAMTTAASISASADNATVNSSAVNVSESSVCAAMADGGITGRGGILSRETPTGDVKPGEWRYDPETDTHGDYNYWQRKKIRQQHWKKFAFYNKVKGTKKKISIINYGIIHAKNVKLYGRKCLGIDEYTGNWILGKWEQLNENTSFVTGHETHFNVSGEYVCFAFS